MEILVPISLGELYDRISILEIKKFNIKDENKLIFVNKELELLNLISEKYPIRNELYLELKKINKILWDVEDKLREQERIKLFDENFISLARKVYFTNDKRSETKRQINEEYASPIVEVKSYEKYS